VKLIRGLGAGCRGRSLPRRLDRYLRGDDIQAGDDVLQRLPADHAALVGAQITGQVVPGWAAWIAGHGLAWALDGPRGLRALNGPPLVCSHPPFIGAGDLPPRFGQPPCRLLVAATGNHVGGGGKIVAGSGLVVWSVGGARQDRRRGLPQPRRELVDQREIEAGLGVHRRGQVLAGLS
jgi:hypothetical protein